MSQTGGRGVITNDAKIMRMMIITHCIIVIMMMIITYSIIVITII